MRLVPRGPDDARRLHLELAPMIDVVFLLIIFFMTTAQFARDTRAELDLPQERGEQEERGEEAGLIINVARDGSIMVGPESTDLAGLEGAIRAELAARPPDAVRVTLRADRAGDAARLNEIVALLRRHGIGGAKVATEVPRR